MSKAKKIVTSKKPARKLTLFVVMRDSFTVFSFSGIMYTRDEDERSQNVGVPMRAFARKKSAEEHARRLDDELRANFPPPLFTEQDPPPEKLVAPKVLSLGLPAIRFGKVKSDHPKQFREWWAENAKNMSAEQKAALWEPFASMKFHRVKAIELEG